MATNEDQHHQPKKISGKAYAVERKVDHNQTENGIYYHVHWFGYETADDTYYHGLHISTQPIDHYWNRIAGNMKSRK